VPFAFSLQALSGLKLCIRLNGRQHLSCTSQVVVVPQSHSSSSSTTALPQYDDGRRRKHAVLKRSDISGCIDCLEHGENIQLLAWLTNDGTVAAMM